ncbi:LCP family protein [Butyrivibrio fibrisolvens]|uniref:LCP family protein n=1 Tax=Butyrivibrio fibrisolvens TaxID=831 RepID=UPI000686D0B4|nr:LCP family protein [Butyrivibrio fibrisolvens]
MRKRKFYKDTSLPKDGNDLVMDYDMGDLIQEVRPYRNATEELEFEDIKREHQRARQQDEIGAWISTKKSSDRPSDTSPYISNRQLYDSSINGTDIQYRSNDKDKQRDNRTGIEQLSQIRTEKGPAKPFKSRAEEVKYQFSEKKRQEEIRKFTRQRQQENRIKRQKDEDRRRTEELKKLFDLEDGDGYRESLTDEDLRNLRSINGLGRKNAPGNRQNGSSDRSGNDRNISEKYIKDSYSRDSYNKEKYSKDSYSKDQRDSFSRYDLDEDDLDRDSFSKENNSKDIFNKYDRHREKQDRENQNRENQNRENQNRENHKKDNLNVEDLDQESLYKESHNKKAQRSDDRISRDADMNARINNVYDDEDDFIDARGFDPSKIKSGGAKIQESQYHSHRHHSHSRKGRAFRIIRNILLVSMAVVIGFAGIGYGAYKLMDYTGGLSLYQRTKEQAPDLSQASLYEQVTIDDDQMPLSASAWQPGWIRYDGKTYAYNTNLLTFLVLGIDSMDKVHEAEDGLSGGQSDAMFFLVLDPDNKDIKIIAINRNTMTDIDVYNEEGVYVGTGEAQICLQHGFGDGLEESCVRTVKTVKNLFHELPINGYISINMGAIPTVNDTVGGVTLKVKYDLPAAGQYRSLRKGDTVTLSGDDAYWYTQHRDINDDFSANERLERQLQYLIEFIPSLQERVKEDPKSIASVYNALSPYMVTDIGLNEAVYLGNEAAQYSFDSANIYQMKGESIIGRSGFEEFIYDEDGLYDLIIDVFYTEVDA